MIAVPVEFQALDRKTVAIIVEPKQFFPHLPVEKRARLIYGNANFQETFELQDMADETILSKVIGVEHTFSVEVETKDGRITMGYPNRIRRVLRLQDKTAAHEAKGEEKTIETPIMEKRDDTAAADREPLIGKATELPECAFCGNGDLLTRVANCLCPACGRYHILDSVVIMVEDKETVANSGAAVLS